MTHVLYDRTTFKYVGYKNSLSLAATMWNADDARTAIAERRIYLILQDNHNLLFSQTRYESGPESKTLEWKETEYTYTYIPMEL